MYKTLYLCNWDKLVMSPFSSRYARHQTSQFPHHVERDSCALHERMVNSAEARLGDFTQQPCGRTRQDNASSKAKCFDSFSLLYVEVSQGYSNSPVFSKSTSLNNYFLCTTLSPLVMIFVPMIYQPIRLNFSNNADSVLERYLRYLSGFGRAYWVFLVSSIS